MIDDTSSTTGGGTAHQHAPAAAATRTRADRHDVRRVDEPTAATAQTRFTPDQAARVLHRAIALESDRRERLAADLTLDELVEIGTEIGLDGHDVVTAAALERFDPGPDRGGIVMRLAGPPVIAGQRIVHGAEREISARVEEWVRVQHCMRVRYRDGDETHWEPTGGILGSIRRGARQVAGEPVIDGLAGITTRVSPAGAGRFAVGVEFDPGSRERTFAQAGTIGAMLAVAGVATGVLFTPLAYLAVPLGLAVAAGVVVARRRTVKAAEREIQRLMSGVGNGERPVSAFDAMRGRLRGPRSPRSR